MLNLSSNVDEVLDRFDRMSRQYPFAVAKALTDVARKAAQAMPAEAAQDLDNPAPFTLRGFYSTRADKVQLVAEVGIKDAQSAYLKWQVDGGVRQPARKALRLPGDVELDVYGNMPKGLVKQLVQRAKAGKRVTKAQSVRMGVSQQVSLFYGDPQDGRPAGVYKRVGSGDSARLVPLVLFPARSATYRKRFDFRETAERVVRREFVPTLRAAWKLAQATAR